MVSSPPRDQGARKGSRTRLERGLTTPRRRRPPRPGPAGAQLAGSGPRRVVRRARVVAMDVSELLGDALGRVREQMPDVVGGLGDDDLAWRPDPGANSIAWLVWHLSRIEDDHVSGVAGTEQVWTSGGWYDRF